MGFFDSTSSASDLTKETGQQTTDDSRAVNISLEAVDDASNRSVINITETNNFSDLGAIDAALTFAGEAATAAFDMVAVAFDFATDSAANAADAEGRANDVVTRAIDSSDAARTDALSFAGEATQAFIDASEEATQAFIDASEDAEGRANDVVTRAIDSSDDARIDALSFAGEATQAFIDASENETGALLESNAEAQAASYAFSEGVLQDALSSNSLAIDAVETAASNSLAFAAGTLELLDDARSDSAELAAAVNELTFGFAGEALTDLSQSQANTLAAIQEQSLTALASSENARIDALEFAGGTLSAFERLSNNTIHNMTLAQAGYMESVEQKGDRQDTLIQTIFEATVDELADQQTNVLGVISESAKTETERGVDNILELAKMGVIAAGVIALGFAVAGATRS